MKYKIGIYGSSAGDIEKIMPKAQELSRAIQKFSDKIIIFTGAGNGLPYEVAKSAANAGVEVWGFSDSISLAAHKKSYPSHDLKIYKKLIFLDKALVSGFSDRVSKKFRNVISTSQCDAGIIISGRWGSMNEFTNLVDMQKKVGVLTGTGGFADELLALVKKISKEGQGEIIFESDPKILVEKILKTIS